MARTVDAASLGFVVLWAGWVFTTPLRSGANLFQFAQDDFFLYLTVARNLARGLGSTFDGTTATNGYHPLYEALLWAFCRVGSGLPTIFCGLAALNALSATAIFLAVRALARSKVPAAPGGWLANGCGLLALGLCASLLAEQMEVTLTLPLALTLLLLVDRVTWQTSLRRWFGIGVLAGLLTLSRLDAALLVGLWVGAGLLVLGRDMVRAARPLAAAAAGYVLFVGTYFAINLLSFGRWLPVSGAAKQLRTTHGFAWEALRHSASPATAAMFVCALLAGGWLAVSGRRLPSSRRVAITAALAFPFVHWGLIGFVSDWHLWGWYTYSVRLAMIGVVLLSATLLPSAGLRNATRRSMAPLVFALGLVALAGQSYRIDPEMRAIADAAVAVQRFARQHPGRYAMGDRGGMVAYAIDQPVVQLEGLMMDGAFLERIRRQQPLAEVLRAYRVDFYIGFARRTADGTLPAAACFAAREPAQAGPDSPTLQGTFCGVPAMELDGPTGRTVIFALDPPR